MKNLVLCLAAILDIFTFSASAEEHLRMDRGVFCGNEVSARNYIEVAESGESRDEAIVIVNRAAHERACVSSMAQYEPVAELSSSATREGTYWVYVVVWHFFYKDSNETWGALPHGPIPQFLVLYERGRV